MQALLRTVKPAPASQPTAPPKPIGSRRQKCIDSALKLLGMRLHSRSELARKLARKEFDRETIDDALAELQRVGYVDDRRFAVAKAQSLMEHKKHGRRRAFAELIRAGVSREVADQALNEVYGLTESVDIARQLALKQAPRLRKLDPVVARRRLVGMLQRRGFSYDAIKPLLDEVLGRE